MTKICECGCERIDHFGETGCSKCPCKKFKEKIEELPSRKFRRVIKKAGLLDTDFSEKPTEFNLSEKIDKKSGAISVWNVKTFIKKCAEHSFTTDEGLRVIDMNKLKELAGEELSK